MVKTVRGLKRWRASNEGGFSLIELMVVVAITGILLAMTLPPFVSWRKTLSYRQTAHGIQAMLKEAKSLTITRNLQHMVFIEPGSSRYTLIPGNRAYNTAATGWGTALQTVTCPSGVTIRSKSDGTSSDNVYIQFNPNGTVRLKAPNGTGSDGNVTVNDGSSVIFCITVSESGRIRMEKR
jgi:prepilin-type N-terminal cleavage/methylation domain-containing protein